MRISTTDKTTAALPQKATRQSSEVAVTELVLGNPHDQPVSDVPLRIGVDLPRGRFHEDVFALRTESGEPTTVQTTPLAQWSDGSLKWVLFDFVASNVPSGRSCYSIAVPTDVATTTDFQSRPVVTVDRDVIAIQCGDLRSELQCVLRSADGHE